MARVYAADDYRAIRARLAEIRGERSETAATKTESGPDPRPIRSSTTAGKRLLRDLAFGRRFRVGGKIVLSGVRF